MSYLTETWDQSDAIQFSLEAGSDLPIVNRRMGRPYQRHLYYSDVNSKFTLNSSPMIVIDDEAINYQIDNVLSTPLRSDWFEPTFGSLLPYRLFESITPATAFLLRNDTIDAVGKWLSSKLVMDTVNSAVNPILDDPDLEGYYIDMRYQIIRTKAIATYSMAFVR